MKAVVCCLFLWINKSGLAVKLGKNHGEGRELKFCTVVTSTAARPLLIGESSDFINQLYIYTPFKGLTRATIFVFTNISK